MSISRAERHQIENEMIFRRVNEKVGEELGSLDAMHVEDGNAELTSDPDIQLEFKCECSNEECTLRILMRLDEYKSIHTDRDTFIVIPGHQVEPIEKVVQEEDRYSVVRKNNSTPEPSDELNDTILGGK